MRQYYADRADKIKTNVKRRYEKNRPAQLEYRKQYYRDNKVVLLQRSAQWIKAHPELHKRYQQKFRDAVRAKVIAAYGSHCVCCGETEQEFLTVDHIHGGGRKDRELGRGGHGLYRWLIQENFPKDHYRLLCMNCNFAKGIYGRCPHQKPLLHLAKNAVAKGA